MKIVDLLKRESVELNGKVTSKPEAIEKMVALMAGRREPGRRGSL